MTMSNEPRMTTASASLCPTAICDRQVRFTKRGRPAVVAVRIRRSVRDQVEADLAFRALDARVGLALGRLEHLGHLGANVAFGNQVKRLLQDARALAHLQEAQHVAVEAVAVEANRARPSRSGRRSSTARRAARRSRCRWRADRPGHRVQRARLRAGSSRRRSVRLRNTSLPARIASYSSIFDGKIRRNFSSCGKNSGGASRATPP